MKVIIVLGVCFLQTKLFASLNEAELTAFFQTVVNITPQEGIETVKDYRTLNNNPSFIDPVQSAAISPLPGQKGTMDATVSLLCLTPMANQAVALAQFRFIETTLFEKLNQNNEESISSLQTTINNKEGEITILESSLNTEKKRVFDLIDLLLRYQSLVGNIELDRLSNGNDLKITKEILEEAVKQLQSV